MYFPVQKKGDKFDSIVFPAASKFKMMIKKIILLASLSGYLIPLQAQEKKITPGMKITRSVKISRQLYRLNAPESITEGLIVIEGDNITVDFNQAVLQGSNTKKKPNEFWGVAVYIKPGKNITLKNLQAKGYKIALFAKNVTHLSIENCDFSYNYRQQLNSTQEKEDIADWLSYHQNEKDEWLRYGAALYLRACDSFTITKTRVTGGQNALLMTDCHQGKIYYNDFSFNSGLGIGMYRCSQNMIAYNKINFNVRGYSHGVYNRGQDSAGILVYEQSNNNYFFKNSVTHSGDGFFLWAGQSTMDTGQGGCNDNIVVGNDFSYAPTNGIEATFSRNVFVNNRVYECDHGVWGGYSYQTVIEGNQFRNNRIAIAIEHGQENKIQHNIFFQNEEAIRLWGRKEQPANWGYAKYRDTRSRDYRITNNNFNGNKLVMNLSRTENLQVANNIFSNNDRLFRSDSTVINLDTSFLPKNFLQIPVTDSLPLISEIDPDWDPFQGNGRLAGRNNILITEWGPYDFRSPIIWNTNPTDTSETMYFDLIGPQGKWKIKNYKGVKDISASQGVFPASLTATRLSGSRTDIRIELEYTGSAITTPMGQHLPAGKTYRFSYQKFFQPIAFHVAWYAYDFTEHDPLLTGQLLPPNKTLKPIKTEKATKLDYAWWGGIKNEEGDHLQFVTTATGVADFEKGTYELGITWDDAVRIYIDNKRVIDEWNPSLYKFDESPHKTVKLFLEGRHTLKVEHVELGGFATLSLKLKKLN